MTAEATPKNILVIDDDEATLSSLSTVLEKEGYHVLTASNGREALDLMLKGNSAINLILLDLYMPQVNGWQFAHYLKKYSGTHQQNIPIVISSSVDSDLGNDAASSFEGFLQKPIVYKNLIETCKRLCP